MDVEQLRTFLAVLEHGGFSRAAVALRVGQSTVSFHIKALETAAGARLLDRGSGTVRATAAGVTLKRYARRIVSLRDEALDRLRSEESGEIGRFAIAASTVPAEHLLPPLLASFLAAHPRVAVSLEISDSKRAIALLLAQECELAFVGARSRDKRIAFRAFADDTVLLVGRATPPLTSPRPTPAELGKVRLIVRESGSGTRAAAARFLGRAASDDPLPPLEVSSSQAAKQCALAGVGLAFLSRHLVADELARGQLVAIAAPGLPIRRRFYLARLRSVTLPAAARAFARLVVA